MEMVSYPYVNYSALPLDLPLADVYNSGGFKAPVLVNGKYELLPSYSNIDLLVAGLEADRLGQIVKNLPSFFDSHRQRLCEFNIYLTYKKDSVLYTESIFYIKAKIKGNELSGSEFIKIAPLTFKSERL